MKNRYRYIVVIFILSFFSLSYLHAAVYGIGYYLREPSPRAACEAWAAGGNRCIREDLTNYTDRSIDPEGKQRAGKCVIDDYPCVGNPYGGYFIIEYEPCDQGVANNGTCIECQKDEGEVWVSALQSCKKASPKNAGQACGEDLLKGNPINIAIGNKYQREEDYRAGGAFPLIVSRSYNSEMWSWQFFPEITVVSAGMSVAKIRADGKRLTFTNNGSTWVSDSDVMDTLTATEDTYGNITGWTYTTSNDQIENYDAQGRILSVTDRNGMSHTYSYQTDSITVTHSNGDTLVYHLDSAGRVSGFTDPDNRDYQYSYDTEGRLAGITFPDDTPADPTDNPQRIYHYENSAFPHALTGITDENGNRFATWTYDGQGRAISSEHAGGVDKTTLTYNADGTTTVTNPLGKQTTYHFTTINGVRKVTQVEGHPTATCEGANKAYSYDANGNIISKTDWNGVTTTYTYDMERNLELSRTEAVGTPLERTITTEWHADYRLPVKITEPNRITEYTYDAQGRRLTSKVSSVQ